jgi:hypothetical protein
MKNKGVTAKRAEKLAGLTAKQAEELADRCMVFVDRNSESRIISKSSTPVNASLAMSYDSDELRIKFHVYSHSQGNGSCGVKVHFRGKKVFDASGCYTAAPFNVKVTKYVPGAWEETIPPISESE